MTVRLNITLPEDTYQRLKQQARPKGMSAYIDEALKLRLKTDRAALDEAYRQSWSDEARFEEAADWTAVDVDGWPSW